MKRRLICFSLVFILFLGFAAVINVVWAPDAHDMAVTDVFFLATEMKSGQVLDVQITVRNNGTNTENNIQIKVYYNSSYPTSIPDTLIQTYNITTLTTGQQNQTWVSWDTTGRSEGQYMVSAHITPVPGETRLYNNQRAKGIGIIEHDVLVSSLQASPTGVTAGQSVTINATVENQGIYTETFDVAAYYDSTKIGSNQTVSSLAPGGNSNRTFTWDTTGVSSGSYVIKVEASRVSGELIRTANNVLRSTDAIDYGVVRIPPVHDIAISSASLSPSIVSIGDIVTINVIVENQGDATETFDVTPYYDSTPATPKQTVTLASRNHTGLPYTTKLVTFNWDTTGLPFGNYTVSVVVSQVAGETDTADNTYTSPLLRVITPTIYFAPATMLGIAGTTADVKLMVAYAPDVYSWQALMYFDNTKVQVLNAVEGDFLGGPGPNTFFSKSIRNDLGRAFVSCTLLGSIPPVTGSGWLATISLNFTATSDSTLNINNAQTVLSDNLAREIPSTPQNGQVVAPWPEDINLDGIVDIFDLVIVAINWGNTGSAIQPPEADINGDNVVDILDLSMVAIKYGEYAPY